MMIGVIGLALGAWVITRRWIGYRNMAAQYVMSENLMRERATSCERLSAEYEVELKRCNEMMPNHQRYPISMDTPQRLRRLISVHASSSVAYAALAWIPTEGESPNKMPSTHKIL